MASSQSLLGKMHSTNCSLVLQLAANISGPYGGLNSSEEQWYPTCHLLPAWFPRPKLSSKSGEKCGTSYTSDNFSATSWFRAQYCLRARKLPLFSGARKLCVLPVWEGSQQHSLSASEGLRPEKGICVGLAARRKDREQPWEQDKWHMCCGSVTSLSFVFQWLVLFCTKNNYSGCVLENVWFPGKGCKKL